MTDEDYTLELGEGNYEVEISKSAEVAFIGTMINLYQEEYDSPDRWEEDYDEVISELTDKENFGSLYDKLTRKAVQHQVNSELIDNLSNEVSNV